MGQQTITGIVLDTAGDPWADTSVEVQFDNGSGALAAAGVVGKTNEDGEFSIAVFNNSAAVTKCLARLEDGSLFAFDIDPEDETTDAGTLASSGGSGQALLTPVPNVPVAWGDMTGDLADQEDLQAALDAKADAE